MADVKKVLEGSISYSQNIESGSSQVATAALSSTAEDMQALWAVIKGWGGEVGSNSYPTIPLVAGAWFGIGWLARLAQSQYNAAGRSSFNSSPSMPLPLGISPEAVNPILLTPEGEFRLFRTVGALDWRLARLNGFRLDRNQPGFSPEEIEAFSHAGLRNDQRTIILPDGRSTLIEFTIRGGRQPDGAQPKLEPLSSSVVFIYDGKNLKLLGVQIKIDGGPVKTPFVDETRDPFELIRLTDRFTRDVALVEEKIVVQDPHLRGVAAKELARRALTGWKGLSVETQKNYLGTQRRDGTLSFEDLGFETSDRPELVGEDGRVVVENIAKEVPLPPEVFVRGFLSMQEAIVFRNSVYDINARERKRDERRRDSVKNEIREEAVRAFGRVR